MEKLISTPPDDTSTLGFRDRVIFETLYSTGMRISELVGGLKVLDVDMNREIMKVTGGKGGSKQRLVPMYGTLAEKMRTYIEVRHNELVKKNRRRLAVSESERQKKLDREYVWMLVKKNIVRGPV